MLFDKIRNFYLRYQLKGFIGPKYKGLFGKFKLYMQSWTGHVEIVSCAEPGTWKMNPEKLNPRIRIEIIERLDGSMKYLEEMRRHITGISDPIGRGTFPGDRFYASPSWKGSWHLSGGYRMGEKEPGASTSV